MRVVLTLLVVLAAVPACTRSDELAAQAAVQKILKNPDSPPKYGKFTRIGKNKGCMTVNPRDAKGEYVGDTYILLEKVNDEWTAGFFDRLTSHEMCVKVWSAQ
jgi:hypothetical protein